MTEPALEPLVLRADDGATATLTLNRPAKRNALNVELFVELEAHLADLETQTEVIGAVVLRGAGGLFSAGADLSKPTKAPRRNFQASVIERLATLPQPVVGVVDGICFTGGLELILAADIIIASEAARFADTHSKFALVGGWGMSQRLPRRVGPYKAREIILASREYSGRQAEAMGLINVCVAPDALEAELQGWLDSLLGHSWFSNREHKRIQIATDGLRIADGLAYEAYRSPGVGPDFADRVTGKFGH